MCALKSPMSHVLSIIPLQVFFGLWQVWKKIPCIRRMCCLQNEIFDNYQIMHFPRITTNYFSLLHVSLRRVPRITVICCRLETKTSSNRPSNTVSTASKGNSNSEPDLRTPLKIRQMNIVNVQSVNCGVSWTVSSCELGWIFFHGFNAYQ